MYTAKHAMLYQHKVHGGESTVFYMDIRAGGKNYEEFVRRAIEEDGVNYVDVIRKAKILKDSNSEWYYGNHQEVLDIDGKHFDEIVWIIQ